MLAKLPYAANATINHYSRQGDALCLLDTRTEVLNEIMAWARGGSSCGALEPGVSGLSVASGQLGIGRRQRIYWLNGMAGTGKSTIARTIARQCLDEGILGASFFFSRGGGELETARMFVTSIAVQLARRSPALKKLICAAVREDPDILDHTLGDQWRQLVLRPCCRLNCAAAATAAAAGAFPALSAGTHGAAAASMARGLVVVIDALDECNDAGEITFVLQLLSETSGLAVSRLHIFLTSRPEIPIREGFQDIPATERRHLILHRIDPLIVDHDIRAYLEHNLGSIILKSSLHSGLPYDTILQELVDRAGGLFVWAATACRFIHEGELRAVQRLNVLLSRQVAAIGVDPQQKLDDISLASSGTHFV